MHTYVNERWVVSDSIGPLRNSAGALKSADTDMANILNDYFVSAFTIENTKNIPEVEQYEELQPLENVNFGVNEVQGQPQKTKHLQIYRTR